MRPQFVLVLTTRWLPPPFPPVQEFNKQFADPEWVAATKHWPPRLMAALNRFLSLQ